MNEIVKGISTAPLATIFVIAGVIFLFVGIVGNISGKIEPSSKARIISGIFGLAFIGIGLGIHFSQKQVSAETLSAEISPQKNPSESAELPHPPAISVTKSTGEAIVSTPSTEIKPSTTVATLASTEVIEAGCSFRADQIEGEPGSTNIVACPAGCDADSAVLYGSDVYTSHSYICVAAIHAGLISAQQGGSVGVIIEHGRPAYRGSTRNKVRSYDYGKFGGSFRLSPAK